MTTAGLVGFNLLLNGVGSFVVAWLLSRAAMRLFRPAPGRAYIVLAALPFMKVAFDLAHGVPDGSFLWLRARGVPQDLGSFQLGLGLSWCIPKIDLALSALSGGLRYSQSAADLVAAFLSKRVGPWAPGAIALLLISVALLRLGMRAVGFWRAAVERRLLGKSAGLAGRRRVGRRTALVLVSESIEGSPFTGGVFAPYIGFPRRVWEALSAAERRAALEHEVAHVAEHHVLITTLVGIVRDVFWFVPFIAAAERRVREACELSADARAVKRGAAPEVLASALLRAREVMSFKAPARAATLAANETSLAARITRLLEPPPLPRLGFQHLWPRVLMTVWLCVTVLGAVALGNH